jgi:ATP-dependent DNA ligase
MDLEGVVAKNRREAYAAGSRWIKVKCKGYSQGVGRGELFHPMR